MKTLAYCLLIFLGAYGLIHAVMCILYRLWENHEVEIMKEWKL